MTDSPPLRQTLASHLSRLRAKRGRSVAECAEAAQVSLDYWYRLERGEKWPSDAILARVAAALGTLPDRLLRPAEKN
jgi:transcriptional regulator with XRE-family HTH domain